MIIPVNRQNTDIATLLTSAQQVSHHWHALIQQSEKLQIALFFKPNKKKHRWGSRKRILNPLIKANLWPGFFLKELHTRPRWQYCIEKEYFTLINPQKEHAYLRQEASWRRMLMYQPPTSHVAIIELETTRPSPEYTQIFLQPKDGDFLRLGNLNTGINYCGMAPCQDPLLFWYQGGHMKRNKRQYQGERKFSVSKLLVDCDAVIFLFLALHITCKRISSIDIGNDYRHAYIIWHYLGMVLVNIKTPQYILYRD
ncbi:hypothetical protein ASPWEDRAFT_28185 [Aspergillus wentii DTO 134E9]|uniref:Uncharacterized protein n=1 Tax=Aspergillus wentii DTO 134E9 TaxID=1073089 RepID=A0A1L9RL07_ASPWE|nr:uncharacterized protein ASPWEDRAFT_28185 [Aspergillus wentii DTO 134E9]OJJ35563.1 hypothetical protein ASPWEDRAFT_28185 [Aspergillus wentii DTO 134E9]